MVHLDSTDYSRPIRLTSEYVLAIHSSGKPFLRCSVAIQLSKAENRRFVDIPPRTRPSSKISKLL